MAAFQIGNPSLEREASINTDLSFRWQSSRLQAKLTGYRNGIRNYIYLVNTETVDSATGIPIMRAIQGDAVLWGVDASLQAQLLPWLRLNGLFRLVSGKNTDTAEELPLLPASAVEGEVMFTQPSLWGLQNLYLSVGLRFVGDKDAAGRYEPFWQYDNNPNFGLASTARYMLVHAAAGFDFALAGQRANVDLIVHNLMDEVYRNFLDTYKGYALSLGRDVRLRVNVPFGSN